MKRQYYLRGRLVEVDQVDEVVVRRLSAAERSTDAGAPGEENARAAVLDTVRGVAQQRADGGGLDASEADEQTAGAESEAAAALDAFAAADWTVHTGSADSTEVSTVDPDAPDGVVVVTPGGRVAIATDRLTVQLSDDPAPDQVDSILAEAGLDQLHTLGFAPHLYQVRTVRGDALQASAQLNDLPGFVFAEPELVEHVPTRFTPTDPRFGDQWQWANTGQAGGTAGADVSAEEAWDITFGAGIRVAVIDNGFDADHDDLAAGVLGSSAFYVSNGANPATFTVGTAGMPDSAHGTFCAGMVGARQGNAIGLVGGAPESDLQLLACLGDQVGSQITLARAVAYAADPSTEGQGGAGADIIVSSLGPNGAEWNLTTTLDLALQAAAANGRGGLGTAIFWAASNGNNVDVLQDEVVSHADVIAVVRSTRNDLEDNAARGPEVELIAPGVDVWATNSGNGYRSWTGTSFAAPCAASCAALALSVQPGLTRDQLRTVMRETADQIGGVTYDANGHNDDYGFGRVNAFAAVRQAARRITLLTNPVEFTGVPEGETTARSITWEVAGVEDLTFDVVTGPTTTSGPANAFSLLLGPSVTVPAPGVGATAQARIWLTYTGASAGDTATGTVRVRSTTTGEQWDVDLTASTVERPTAAVMMVMDRSGSMDADAGDGRTRVQVLRESAGILVDLLKPDTGIGVARFDHDAALAMSVTAAGPEVFGAGRAQAAAAVAGHATNPSGLTSIGDGVDVGAQALTATGGAYDVETMIVLTDGQENAPKSIADVAGQIDDRVFAIGLGTPAAINPVALTALTDGTGGYVNVTGELSADERFLLAKYYLQILAGVTNDQIVLDPGGHLMGGDGVKVPFPLTGVDSAVDVILLTPAPQVLRYTLVTPSGRTLEPTTAGLTYVTGDQVAYYRFTLPLVDPGTGKGDAAGEWLAIVECDRDAFKRYLAELEEKDPALFEEVRERGVPYLVQVHATSSLTLSAQLDQDHSEPGAVLRLTARLDEMGIPVDGKRASVRAELTGPSGPDVVPLDAVSDGVFVAEYKAVDPGLYRFRLVAEGTTLRSEPFTREQLVTGAVYRPEEPNDDGGPPDKCRETIETFVSTVEGEPRLAKQLDTELRERGSSLDELLHCLRER